MDPAQDREIKDRPDLTVNQQEPKSWVQKTETLLTQVSRDVSLRPTILLKKKKGSVRRFTNNDKTHKDRPKHKNQNNDYYYCQLQL